MAMISERAYVWILQDDFLLKNSTSVGLPAELVLPQAAAPVPVSLLSNSRIWMCVKHNSRVILLAVFHIKQIDQFQEGFNLGDFVLVTDLRNSFRLSDSVRDTITFDITHLVSSESQVSLCTPDQDRGIALYVRDRTTKSLLAPSQHILNRIGRSGLIFGKLASDIKDNLQNIVRLVALNEIAWRKGREDLPPFASLALEVVRYQGAEIGAQLKAEYVALDPLARLLASFTSIRKSSILLQDPRAQTPSSVPSVDLDFQPIDPTNIRARKFVARRRIFFNDDDGIKKTETAEKEHQEILRIVSEHLISMGYQPLQSSSVDLLVQLPSKSLLFEIKSANIDNIAGQAAKGTFQIFAYEIAFRRQNDVNTQCVLVISSSGNLDWDKYICAIVERAGCRCLFFRGDLAWPEKVHGLEATIAQSS